MTVHIMLIERDTRKSARYYVRHYTRHTTLSSSSTCCFNLSLHFCTNVIDEHWFFSSFLKQNPPLINLRLDTDSYSQQPTQQPGRNLAQIARRRNERALSPHLLCARQPYNDNIPTHSLGRMDIQCHFCGALHWQAEKLTTSPLSSPLFGTCCNSGKVRIPLSTTNSSYPS
jgi:hypothetical protein